MNIKKNSRGNSNSKTSQPVADDARENKTYKPIPAKRKLSKKDLYKIAPILVVVVGLVVSAIVFINNSEPAKEDTSNEINNEDSIVAVEDVEVVQEAVVADGLLELKFKDLKFDNYEARANQGDVVKWVNDGGEACQFKLANYNSGEVLTNQEIKDGEEYSHTFESLGAFTYECTNDEPYKGVVRIYEPGDKRGQ